MKNGILYLLIFGLFFSFVCFQIYFFMPTTWNDRGNFGDFNGFLIGIIAAICAFLVYWEQIKQNKQNQDEFIRREFFEEIKTYYSFINQLEYNLINDFENKLIKGPSVLQIQGMLLLTDPDWYKRMGNLGVYSVLELLDREGYFELSASIYKIIEICNFYNQYPLQTWPTLKRFIDGLSLIELLFIYIYWADSGKGLADEELERKYQEYIYSKINLMRLRIRFEEHGNLNMYKNNIKLICVLLDKDINEMLSKN